MFTMELMRKKVEMPAPGAALPGRPYPITTAERHFVNGRLLKDNDPEGAAVIYLGMGCFWGAERLFWSVPGVYLTAVGYAGGETPNPTYQETTTGMTGHAEVVRVVYDPQAVPLSTLLAMFFEEHDPTQGMRQGNDIGTTYRSAIYTTDAAQLEEAIAARNAYQAALSAAGRDRPITTEIGPAGPFYYAEEYHQQYLAKNPDGYCGLRGTGVACPVSTRQS